MKELNIEELHAVSGGDAYYDIGHGAGEAVNAVRDGYSAARAYFAESVFPFYFG